MTHTLTTYNEAVHTAPAHPGYRYGIRDSPIRHLAGARLSARPHEHARSRLPCLMAYLEAEAIVLNTERERQGTATWEDATASSIHRGSGTQMSMAVFYPGADR